MNKRNRKIRKTKSLDTGRRGGKKGLSLPKVFLYFLIIALAFIGVYRLFVVLSDYSGSKIVNRLSESAAERLLIERDGLESILIAVKSSHEDSIVGAWIVVSNEKLGSTMVYYIPPRVYLRDYSGAFEGYVPVANLAYAGEVLDPKRDIEYTLWQISNLSGIAIDSYIFVDSDALDLYSSIFGDVSEFSDGKYSVKYTGAKDVPTSAYLLHSFVDRLSLIKLVGNSDKWGDLSKNIYSNMNTYQVVSEVKRLSSLFNAGGVIMFDLSQDWASTTISVDSDREISLINYHAVDEYFERYTNIVRGREIEREQVKVEVYNASGIPEIAYRYARRLRNSGIGVARYENAPEISEKTKIYVTRPDDFAASLDLVKKVLVVEVEEINTRPAFITTGDIVILLGKDMQAEIDWK